VLSSRDYFVVTKISQFFPVIDWHQPSQIGGQMHQVFTTLATKFPNLVFLTVDAEETPALSEQFDVAVVPTFVCVSPDNTVFWRHEGLLFVLEMLSCCLFVL
jgi:hypothetical protein